MTLSKFLLARSPAIHVPDLTRCTKLSIPMPWCSSSAFKCIILVAKVLNNHFCRLTAPAPAIWSIISYAAIIALLNFAAAAIMFLGSTAKLCQMVKGLAETLPDPGVDVCRVNLRCSEHYLELLDPAPDLGHHPLPDATVCEHRDA